MWASVRTKEHNRRCITAVLSVLHMLKTLVHNPLKIPYSFPLVSLEGKDKIETRNKELVQTFRIHLTQQPEVLHKTVEISMSRQQRKLQAMEEQMQSFVLTKNEVGETLS